ncbi:acetylornithine aminotransferase [Tilletia horrida]|uniref:Acetylornithine aminotransferase n=1 Tax=Tilletia horrida TaxID=155126 RepID=A0AAN6GF21_9BASI|nr:acetylornithine aminotransferase [Tilletia horrida]KAK0560020.1 acetylornithine aminotransferase [Tilletia horrida]
MAARPASTAITRGYLDRLLAIGTNWPSDPLRPDLHFGRAIELAARKALVQRAPEEGSSAASDSAAAAVSKSGAGKGDTLVLRELNGNGSDAELVERATVALETLRANKLLKRHPTPRHILKPTSHPEYYQRLVSTLDRAGRGEDISPSWQEKMSRFFGRTT